jgi:hypothetical protein
VQWEGEVLLIGQESVMKLYYPLLAGHKLDTENTKPTCVVEDLDELSSSVTGVTELPIELNWTPSNRYDLSDVVDKMRLYETVLSEALSEDEIRKYINGHDLTEFWMRLRLPRRVRYAWESVHPMLRLRHLR